MVGEKSMQVGDLVELSASAKKLKWASYYSGKIGCVLDARYPNWITVQWFGETSKILSKEVFTRSQLKYVRLEKK